MLPRTAAIDDFDSMYCVPCPPDCVLNGLRSANKLSELPAGGRGRPPPIGTHWLRWFLS
jgi:hypothetical protein